MNSSRDHKKNPAGSSANKSIDKSTRTRKPWVTPELIVENVESTKGGNFSCNSPGDDAWYSS